MIIAELYGKLPSRLDNKEDILTSNVFSFFKYSERQLFKQYLSRLGLYVTLDEADNAEFIFWLSYEDGTEPDLVILCGKYYLLFEAKLYSDFAPKTSKIDAQIDREISMGKMHAKNLGKEFIYIAITAEYYKNKNKYMAYESLDFPFVWTNWQFVSSFIEEIIEDEEFKANRDFANDLLALLVKKRLRSFIGLRNISIQNNINTVESIFYNVHTSKFKGEFTGFVENLKDFEQIQPYQKLYQKSFFSTLKQFKKFNNQTIFYHGK